MRLKILRIINDITFLKLLFLRMLGRCKLKCRRTKLQIGICNLYKFIINDKGKGNTIKIEDETTCENSNISIYGSNNNVIIGKNSYVNGLNILIEGNENKIVLGDGLFVMGNTKICVVDGGSVTLGKNCMLSENIEIRATDSHSILDSYTNKRINYEKPIILGEHVWLGTGVTLLKGTEIADGCIVGACSLLAGKKYDENNSIIVGNPGKVVKRNVKWLMPRIK